MTTRAQTLAGEITHSQTLLPLTLRFVTNVFPLFELSWHRLAGIHQKFDQLLCKRLVLGCEVRVRRATLSRSASAPDAVPARVSGESMCVCVCMRVCVCVRSDLHVVF